MLDLNAMDFGKLYEWEVLWSEWNEWDELWSERNWDEMWSMKPMMWQKKGVKVEWLFYKVLQYILRKNGCNCFFVLFWYKTFSYGVQSCLLLLFKKYFAIFIKRNSRFTKLFSKPASLTLSNYSKLIYPLMHQANIIPMILKGYH